MKIHVLCIGNEILRGHTLNTNLAFIGQALAAAGYEVGREVCTVDDPEVIRHTVVEELAGADVLITVGGLGPTSDDVTREAVASALQAPLHFDRDVYASIKAYLAGRNMAVPDDGTRVQSMVPEAAIVLPNANGTAPGLWCSAGAKGVVMLPGPPRELQPLFVEAVLPRLRRLGEPTHVVREIKVCGMPESVAAEAVENVLSGQRHVRPAYCARTGLLDVRLVSAPDRTAELDDAEARVRAALGSAALPAGCAGLAAAVGDLLVGQGWWLATAESCTGGGIGAAITDVPGASAFFRGSAVTYANEWKMRWLGVSQDTLAQHGAVSRETAAEMLEGLLAGGDVQTGIAVTGVAGPSGGTPDKPVGLVFIGTGVQAGRIVRRHVFAGNRETVRRRAVTTALNQLRLQLLDEISSQTIARED